MMMMMKMIMIKMMMMRRRRRMIMMRMTMMMMMILMMMMNSCPGMNEDPGHSEGWLFYGDRTGGGRLENQHFTLYIDL